MPEIKENETRKEFLTRCIPIVVSEGKNQDDAIATCVSIWRDNGKIGDRGGDRGGKQDRPLRKDMKLETTNIGDMEVFEAGTFNGVEMTEKDIDEMINNFDNKVSEPYITIDHSDKASGQFKDALKAMSLGFVSKLKRIGSKLMADCVQVPKTLADLIQAGALKKKSIEFYKKYNHANGKGFKNVLQGITFHGANGSPAVTTLSDFLRLYKNDLQTSNVDDKNKMTSLKFEKENNMENVSISTEEYSELITLKKNNEKTENTLNTLKVENETLQTLKKENEDTITQLKKIEAEFTVFKKTTEDKVEADLKNEAEKYVKEQIDLKKIIPASKDMYEKNYISFKNENDEALKLFKDDIEKRAELLDTGSDTEIEIDNPKNIDVEDVDKIIKTKMKNGKSFNDARKEVYASLGEEV